ncbi:cAMP-dependent protein kinase inhibitor beta isoform X1 [Mustela putorius furo]|uniref:cAMP-dependent protein kinase inhibitor beta isoform X1 n=1 Tax=Mustela putorius furo TaxID=9669 RepID=A0A8U0RC55_MUSPF|nr:cAMP-dependent protein kinase inhibitor beta isoform X1 [Mustela putorius furo]XP_044922341.1 cAMP-dependent protein kinase inhibitor beta isoform X1 [Mustela putorius furo]XP_044922342.1 cAMP-dependent protein kinase inhibitor beta isoform X1 [Mustela putorius furo]XP_044922343.1 cAMP-dependent protein kinase inhibitor beta isoform X1 [Mustela putorius furo]
MDVHLDTPEGQESASNSGKGSSSTGNQQDVAMRTDSSEMTDVESVVNNFASSARTGRRNAVPDIQGSAGMGGSAELPLKLEALSMKEANHSGSVCFAIVFYEPFYVSRSKKFMVS